MAAPIGAEDLTRPHALINQYNIHIDSIYVLVGTVKGYDFIAVHHLLVTVEFKVLEYNQVH